MDRSIVLDVDTNHWPTCGYNGLPESILRTCPCGREALKWAHVNVYASKRKILRYDWIHSFVFQKLLRTVRIERKDCPTRNDLLDFITESLLDNIYLIVFIDDEVVRPNAGSGHHEFLIHGIDPDNCLIKVTGFDDETMFGSFSVSNDLFCLAYERGLKNEECKDFPILRIFAHKECRASDRFETLQKIGHELRLLRDSTMDPVDWRIETWFWWKRFPKPHMSFVGPRCYDLGWRFGMDSYEHILPYVSAIDASPESFDYRFFHFSYQFRQDLYKTFNVYASLNGINIHQEALELQQLLTKLASVRISALRIHHGENLKISQASSLYEQCRESEMNVLDKLSVAWGD